MATASKVRMMGIALVTICALPGLSTAEITGECSQNPDSPPARGQTGSVSVVTTPEKAVVYLGGHKLGLTPVDTAFSSGRHTLTIMLNGEELVNERVNVCGGQKTVIDKKLLLPYGSVVVKTNPNCNCKVTVDGEDIGSTRGSVLTVNKLEAGTRVFRISNGKRSKEVSVNVLPEQTVDLNVDFRK